MGDRRVSTSQVFLDASESGLPFPCIPVQVSPWRGGYCVTPAASGGSLPFQNSLRYCRTTQETPGQKHRASWPRAAHRAGTGHPCQSEPLQPKTLVKHFAPALLQGWEMPFLPPPPCQGGQEEGDTFKAFGKGKTEV